MIELSVPPDIGLVRDLLEKAVSTEDASGFDRVFMFRLYDLAEVLDLKSDHLADLLRQKDGRTRLTLHLLQIDMPSRGRVPSGLEIANFFDALRAAQLNGEPLLDAIYRRLQAEVDRRLNLETIVQEKLERAIEGSIHEAIYVSKHLDLMDADDLRLLVRLLVQKEAAAGRPSYGERNLHMALDYELMRVVGINKVIPNYQPTSTTGAASQTTRPSRNEVLDALAAHYALSSGGVEKALADGNKRIAALRSSQDH
jgi:hypothetical protein